MELQVTSNSNDEDVARRGTEIYRNQILPHIENYDKRFFVAIDIDSGDYEIDVNELTAAHRLKEKHPNAQIWFTRVGSKYYRSFVPRSKA